MKKRITFILKYVLPFVILGIVFWNLYINLRPEITYEDWKQNWMHTNNAEDVYDYKGSDSDFYRYTLMQEGDTYRFLMIEPKHTMFGNIYDYRIQSEFNMDMAEYEYALKNEGASESMKLMEGSFEQSNIMGDVIVLNDRMTTALSIGVQYLGEESKNPNIGMVMSTRDTIFYLPYNDDYAISIGKYTNTSQEEMSGTPDAIQLIGAIEETS